MEVIGYWGFQISDFYVCFQWWLKFFFVVFACYNNICCLSWKFISTFRPVINIFCEVGGKRKFIEVIFVLDGTRNSLLDMDKPFCYLGIHCILFHILLVLWGNYLVSNSFFVVGFSSPFYSMYDGWIYEKTLKYYVLPCCSAFVTGVKINL